MHWIFVVGLALCLFGVPYVRTNSTACDLNLWFGNQTIAWCSAAPPNITVRAVNYTGGCNSIGTAEGPDGIRLWVNLEKGHVQEMVGFAANNCSINDPVFFLAEPFLKLGHCGVVTMFVMLYPIASMRVNCSTLLFD